MGWGRLETMTAHCPILSADLGGRVLVEAGDAAPTNTHLFFFGKLGADY